MRVLVCGGRAFFDKYRVHSVLNSLKKEMHCLITGDATGADELARDWAVTNGIRWEFYCADWEKHGRAAGPIRNQRMIDEGKPDLVVAFPGGRGTADMVARAKALGIKIHEVS